MNSKKIACALLFILALCFPLSSQVLQWQGYWAGGYTSGVPSDPWLVLQPTSAYNFQVIDTNYQTVANFTLPIPGNALYYNVIAASPDFDTDNNIEVLYQYTDGTNYKGHVILRDITTSSNQLTFSDTDTSYYAYTFYFGNERVIIITGTYNSSTHAWLYRSNNPQSIDETNIGLPSGNALMSLYPNPALRFTEIHYSVPVEGDMEIAIYNISGTKLKTLLKAHLPEGEYSVPWYGIDSANRMVTSGTYFSVITINNQLSSKKVVLLK